MRSERRRRQQQQQRQRQRHSIVGGRSTWKGRIADRRTTHQAILPDEDNVIHHVNQAGPHPE